MRGMSKEGFYCSPSQSDLRWPTVLLQDIDPSHRRCRWVRKCAPTSVSEKSTRGCGRTAQTSAQHLNLCSVRSRKSQSSNPSLLIPCTFSCWLVMGHSDRLNSIRDRLAHSRDVFLDNPRFTPVRAVFAAAWGWLQRYYPALVSIAVLRITYAVGVHIWEISVGAWTNTRDYPALRTAVALLMVVVPIWGAVMSTLIIIWWVALPWFVKCTRRMRRGQSNERRSLGAAHRALPVHELPLLSGERGTSTEENEEDDTELDAHLAAASDEKRLRRAAPVASHWWILRLALYVAVAALGPYLWITREYERDWSHRDAINDAVANATREGMWPGKGVARRWNPGASSLTSLSERIFVAALFHNNQDVLPHWTEQMKRLSAYIGSVRVHCLASHIVLITPSRTTSTSP